MVVWLFCTPLQSRGSDENLACMPCGRTYKRHELLASGTAAEEPASKVGKDGAPTNKYKGLTFHSQEYILPTFQRETC